MRRFFNNFTLVLFSMFMLFSNSYSKPKETWLTIYVHGMISIKPHLSFTNFFHFLHDEVENTSYLETAHLVRKDNFFWKNGAQGHLGLQKIDPIPYTGNGASIIAYINESIRTTHDTQDHYYYTFGWSGIMSPRYRYHAAKRLYHDLAHEIARFKKEYNIQPKIRLIGYSHGGSVCLQLATVRKELQKTPFVIDQLVLLGTPVEKTSLQLLKDPVFKKKYHDFSHADRIFRSDIFASKKLYGPRTYKSTKSQKLPSDLVQVRIKITRKTASTKHRKKDPTNNFANRAIIAGNSHLLRDASPGHFEFWFLGWPVVSNKTRFPLYPLPIVGILPYIIETLENTPHNCCGDKIVTFDIRPDNGKVLIKKAKNSCVFLKDFIPIQKLNTIKKNVLLHKPSNYSVEEINARMKQHYDKGVRLHMKKKALILKA